MSNLNRSGFQAHPFHLVSPSAWPILTCVSFLVLIDSSILLIYGFENSVQDITYNQLYNTIIRAHAILIIIFMVIHAMIGGFGNFLLKSPPKPHTFANLPLHSKVSVISSFGNFFKLFVYFLPSCLVFVSVKFPLIFILGHLGLNFLFPVIIAISSTIISFIKQGLSDKKELSAQQLCWIFNISFICSSVSSFIIYYCLPEINLEVFYVILGGVLVDLPFKIEGWVLYANSTSASSSSSGYRGDRSRSASSTVPVGEEKFQFGALVTGLSYSQVSFIRSQVHVIVVNQLRLNCAVSVSEVLINSSNSANTSKVLEKAYLLSNTKFDKESIIAMAGLRTGGGHTINCSPALLELQNMG